MSADPHENHKAQNRVIYETLIAAAEVIQAAISQEAHLWDYEDKTDDEHREHNRRRDRLVALREAIRNEAIWWPEGPPA